MSRTVRNRAHFTRRKAFRERCPNPGQLRDCPQHKLSYPTERIAKQTAAKSLKMNGMVLWAYKCPHCHRWHLTSHPPREEAG